jgi:hypothetical protein
MGPDGQLRLVRCTLSTEQADLCVWRGASTLYQMPPQWQNWSVAVAATPAGGLVAAFIGPASDDAHGMLMLATCDSLDCPQPTVHEAKEFSIRDGTWQAAGTVDVAVDPVSGSIALGFDDHRDDGGLWLGGCPAGCPDGPTLTRPRTWTDGSYTSRRLDIVASTTGPVAVLTALADERHPATLVLCADPACSEERWAGSDWSSAWPLVDGAGDAFIVGNQRGGDPVLLNVRAAVVRSQTPEMPEMPVTTFAGEGRVLAAAFGADGRLRVLLTNPQGTTVLTCLTTCARS